MTIKRSKYNVRTDKIGKLERTADGILFDSKAECERYKELILLQRAGQIRNLQVHPEYLIIWPATGKKICKVKLDFLYEKWPGIWRCHDPWETVVVDVKGKDNAMSKLKRKLVEACHGITVKLITKEKRSGPKKTRAVAKKDKK